MFLVFHLISKDYMTKKCLKSIKVSHGKKSVKVSHDAVKSGGHRHCGSIDIMVLVYQVILLDQGTKGINC